MGRLLCECRFTDRHTNSDRRFGHFDCDGRIDLRNGGMGGRNAEWDADFKDVHGRGNLLSHSMHCGCEYYDRWGHG